MRTRQARPAVSTDDLLDQAGALLDNLGQLAQRPDLVDQIMARLRDLNVNVWLAFNDGRKGRRTVRQLDYGILTLGDAQPPIPYYGSQRVGAPAARPAGDALSSPAEPTGLLAAAPHRAEGVSFTMGNRGACRSFEPLVEDFVRHVMGCRGACISKSSRGLRKDRDYSSPNATVL